MAIHLISLISEHILPNYLLIKEMENEWDKLVFITTERMGQMSMTSRFCNALKIDKSEVKIVVVSEDDLPDAKQKLSDCQFSKNDRYILNLTGGTKIMSIAAFQHFFKYDADYYYIPIGVNKIENVRTGTDLPLNYRLDVEEYLSLYGVKFTFENVDRIQDTTGAEFEAYICNRIKSEKRLKNGFIYRGVKIFRDSNTDNDNEIDVMWTAENQLFMGECKVSLFKPKEFGSDNRPISNPAEYLDEIMYKLSAISKEFGLRVNPYIFIKMPLRINKFNHARMTAIYKRMRLLGVKGLLGGDELKNTILNL